MGQMKVTKTWFAEGKERMKILKTYFIVAENFANFQRDMDIQFQESRRTLVKFN